MNISNQLNTKYTVSVFLTLFVFYFVNGQNCFDADFESGTVGGYTAYHGDVDDEGNLAFPFQNVDITQHRIMSAEDGFDIIADLLCDENKELPVVGGGAGRYSLRLGDSNGGSRTSKVVLSFDVTPDISFLLLKYAVVLEDPDHLHFEQPRFEMNIKDQQGNLLDCGEYKVTAAENIPGFEKCGDWRVRPWTTAGFELKSYIGQTISIEIISTDCSLGGHGGYAYIDASCKPLELILDSYCPDSTFARYFVTDGFETYLWNTGEVTNTIEIEDAMPGVEYSVTVTSATGCTLVLRDTLPEHPELEDIEFSFFNGPDTLDVCLGDQIDYQPLGTNISEFNILEFGYSAESVQFFANESRTIHLVTRDNFGCLYDTMTLVVNVHEIDIELNTFNTCINETNGAIFITNLSNDTLTTSLNNGPYIDTLIYDNLQVGTYTIELKNQFGCTSEISLSVLEVPSPFLNFKDVIPATCGLDNGVVQVSAFGSGMEYSFDGGPFSAEKIWSDLAGGNYTLRFRNGNGCIVTENIDVPSYLPPELTASYADSVYCKNADGVISCSVAEGLSPFTYSINSAAFKTNPVFSELSFGNYEIRVKDDSGCYDTLECILLEAPFVEIEEVLSFPANCNLDNGSMEVALLNDHLEYDLYLADELQSELNIDDLVSGVHLLSVVDYNGCLDEQLITVELIKAPELKTISYIDNSCGSTTASALVEAVTYTDGILFSVNDNAMQTGDEVKLYSGENRIYIQDDYGCEVDTIVILPDVENRSIANIFSPNGDGVNDLLCFQSFWDVKSIEYVHIYDRWGNRVFSIENMETYSQDICWDGFYDGAKVDLGVYVYQIRGRFADGRLLCKSGDITVL